MLFVRPNAGLIFDTLKLLYNDPDVPITENAQLATKKYVDENGGGTTSQSLNQIASTNVTFADVDMNGFTLSNLPYPPTLPTDIV